jgi:hypothetical protein
MGPAFELHAPMLPTPATKVNPARAATQAALTIK